MTTSTSRLVRQGEHDQISVLHGLLERDRIEALLGRGASAWEPKPRTATVF